MALPKPLSQRPTGMPQMRRRSALRTASGNLQEAFLERVRAVQDDPEVVLPVLPEGTPEPKELARLRDDLAKAKEGRLGFFARRDKGVLGAAWACRKLAEKDSAPRLMDARVDGDKRFYWPVGHIRKPACLGVQNWDDPATLLLAYEPLAEEAGLHFYAEPELWCTGTEARLLPEWVEALGKRMGADLAVDGQKATCPHPDRALLVHALHGGPEVRLCRGCGKDDAGRGLFARVRNPGGRRPFGLHVLLPDGSRHEPAKDADALYRIGQRTPAALIDAAVADWHRGLAGSGRFAVGDRLLAGQDEFLDHVEAPAWMRPALAAMTKEGHAAATDTLADVLASHRARLADGIRALGADPEDIARRGGNSDEGALLRMAHEASQRAAKTADLPAVRPSGPVGAWVDGFVRSRRTDGEVVALQKVRRESARVPHKAHVAAFIAACGGDPAMGTGYSHDVKEAGLGMAPLAKRVLEATGPAYVAALREYLEQTGSGETLG